MKLRPSTVSNLTRELLDAGVVRIAGKGKSSRSGGKRSILLSVAADFATFSAFYVHQDQIVSQLIDFQGNILSTIRRSFDPSSPEEVINIIAGEILRHTGRSEAYQGAGIAVSSVVNDAGDVAVSPDFPWAISRFKLKVSAAVENRYPIIVENDANCAAVYAHKELYKEASNLLLFLFSPSNKSMGAGLILDGRLYRGRGGEAGEIIHQEKEEIVVSFASYISRIGVFFAPEILIILGEDKRDKPILSEIYSKVSQENPPYPIELIFDSSIPILGAASLIMDKITRESA